MKKYFNRFLSDNNGSADPTIVTMLVLCLAVYAGIVYVAYLVGGIVAAVATGVAIVLAFTFLLLMRHFRSKAPKK